MVLLRRGISDLVRLPLAALLAVSKAAVRSALHDRREVEIHTAFASSAHHAAHLHGSYHSIHLGGYW